MAAGYRRSADAVFQSTRWRRTQCHAHAARWTTHNLRLLFRRVDGFRIRVRQFIASKRADSPRQASIGGWKPNTLSTLLDALGPGQPYWEAGSSILPMDYFDFKGFVLTNLDGTKYFLDREDLGEYS